MQQRASLSEAPLHVSARHAGEALVQLSTSGKTIVIPILSLSHCTLRPPDAPPRNSFCASRTATCW